MSDSPPETAPGLPIPSRKHTPTMHQAWLAKPCLPLTALCGNVRTAEESEGGQKSQDRAGRAGANRAIVILGSEMSPTGTSYQVSFRLTPHSRSPMPGIPVGMGAWGAFASPVWPLWVGLPLENIFLFFSCLGSLLIGKKKKAKRKSKTQFRIPRF